MRDILFDRANEYLDGIGVELSHGCIDDLDEFLEGTHSVIALWNAFCSRPEKLKFCELSSTIHQTAFLIAKMQTVMQLLQMLLDERSEHSSHV